jgi:hypothetical protein
MTAVLFSIYFAGVTTMADSECIIYLGTPRNTALLTYKRNAEETLARADLLNKPAMATLRALTIYLVCTDFLPVHKPQCNILSTRKILKFVVVTHLLV